MLAKNNNGNIKWVVNPLNPALKQYKKLMKFTLLAIVFLALTTTLKSQTGEHEKIKLDCIDLTGAEAMMGMMKPGKIDYDKVFKKVENDAQFPGGEPASKKYLERNLDSTVAINDKTKPSIYKVSVNFIVDKEGNISDVHAYNPPQEGTYCGLEAEKIIKKGPRWNPAIQNGRSVVFRAVKDITFTAR